MTGEDRRMKLTPAEATLLKEALVGAPASVTRAAAPIGRGEVVPDADAEAVVEVLANVMTEDYSAADGLSVRGNEIANIIGVVQQMSEHFYD